LENNIEYYFLGLKNAGAVGAAGANLVLKIKY